MNVIQILSKPFMPQAGLDKVPDGWCHSEETMAHIAQAVHNDLIKHPSKSAPLNWAKPAVIFCFKKLFFAYPTPPLLVQNIQLMSM